ncbi:MAG: glycosyltransferase [Syntrophaceae bacterium]|nr:glycosyltransferase [Syntrophaceae bacterium]
MYLLVTHIPIYLRGKEKLIDSDWKRSLLLLRDSLEDRLGQVCILAPGLPDEIVPATQIREPLGEKEDGILLMPSIDSRCRAREFWLRERFRWISDIKDLLPGATIVHSALDDVYKPLSYTGHIEAIKAGKPTVYVQDGDIVQRVRDLNKFKPAVTKIRSMVYARIYEYLNRHGIKYASLVLLKGHSLIRRYGHLNSNHRCFVNTSYMRRDIISEDLFEARLASLKNGRPLRFIFFGRLIWEKGVDESIKIINLALKRGANVLFDIIGNGPEKNLLESMVKKLDLTDRIFLRNAIPYGPALMEAIQKADVLLFTSKAEETPRMIFDGYAAGMPLTGYPIDYLIERANEDRCCLPMQNASMEAGADMICHLERNPETVIQLSRKAREIAQYHCAEAWYSRRAAWTFEMLEKEKPSVFK